MLAYIANSSHSQADGFRYGLRSPHCSFHGTAIQSDAAGLRQLSEPNASKIAMEGQGCGLLLACAFEISHANCKSEGRT